MSVNNDPLLAHFHLDYNSVKKIIPDANQAMVYGWGHCKYQHVTEALRLAGSPVQKVFDCSVGSKAADVGKKTTVEGKVIEQLEVNSGKDLSRQCKAGLTNLIFENYLRKQQGLPLIPIIFCVDIDDNPFPTTTPDTVTSRNDQLNTLITHNELRRCYKLAHELEKDPELKDIADIAKETIKFVRIKEKGADNYSLETITPFWDQANFSDKWLERELSKKAPDPTIARKIHKWKDQLLGLKNTSKLQSQTSHFPPPKSPEFNKLMYIFYDAMYGVKPDYSKPTEQEFIDWLINNPNEAVQTDQGQKTILDIAKSLNLSINDMVKDPAFKEIYRMAASIY